MDITLSKPKSDHLVKAAGIALASLTLFSIIYAFVPVQYHWHSIFRPAALSFLRGQSPYAVPGFMNPPWALIPLVPFAVLPEAVGSALVATVTVLALIFVAHRMGAEPLVIVLLILNPYTLYMIYNVNVNWLVVIGYILPPQIGLFFVLVKPQVGIGIAIYWLYECFKDGGVRRVIATFAPVSLALVASVILYGLWPANGAGGGPHGPVWSFWPRSILVGLIILVHAIRSKSMNLSIIASPFLAPYVGHVSIVNPLFGLLNDKWLMIAAFVGLWIVWILSGDFSILSFAS